MRSAYGRSASIRACARRSLEAETSSSAFVILRVLRTERIRRLMSCWLATRGSGLAGDERVLPDLEAVLELLDRGLQLGRDIVVRAPPVVRIVS